LFQTVESFSLPRLPIKFFEPSPTPGVLVDGENAGHLLREFNASPKYDASVPAFLKKLPKGRSTGHPNCCAVWAPAAGAPVPVTFNVGLQTMHSVISAALDAICLERDDQKYSLSFETAAAVVTEFGEPDLANILFSEIPRTVPFELVAELFDLLTWQTDDNGGSIHSTIETWLREGTDNRKLLIALHLDVYPFTNGDEMEKVLSQLAETNTRVSSRCKELIQSRRKLGHAG
jgi:hypothetical protein